MNNGQEDHLWIKTPRQIGQSIARHFPVGVLFERDYDILIELIAQAIEAEREIAKHYMIQIGRWVEKSKERTNG